jgi:hypothetical protein
MYGFIDNKDYLSFQLEVLCCETILTFEHYGGGIMTERKGVARIYCKFRKLVRFYKVEYSTLGRWRVFMVCWEYYSQILFYFKTCE